MNRSIAAASLALAACFTGALHAAETAGSRSGREVVAEACAKCHATGEHGAPRIGDAQAWTPRSARSLSALTQSALNGVRQMPPHGGRLDLSDTELKRAIAYMYNQSGGRWIEPADPTHPRRRTGKEIVLAQCGTCHSAGKDGAPRIGDRAAWIPRLRYGFDTAVSSAINGHGGMPARGGLPDLTDTEIRGAIVYMLNPDPPAPY